MAVPPQNNRCTAYAACFPERPRCYNAAIASISDCRCSTSGSSTGSPRRAVEHVDGHAAAAERGQRSRDGRVAPRPVGAQQRDVAARERVAGRRASVSTSRLFTWQVTHHAAVKSTNTGRPSAVSSATRRDENGSHPSVADRATAVPRLQRGRDGALVAEERPRDRRIRRAHRDRGGRPRCAPATAPCAPRPQRERDQHERRADAHDGVVADLRAEHPDEPRHRRVQRKREQLLQPHHPGAGPRQQRAATRGTTRAPDRAAPCRRPAPRTRRASRATRSRQRIAERGAHERRRARRCDRDGEHARRERVRAAIRMRPRRRCATAAASRTRTRPTG